MHLDEYPHRYESKILCGHCELTVNMKGRLSDAPCDPKYKVVHLRKPTVPEKLWHNSQTFFKN